MIRKVPMSVLRRGDRVLVEAIVVDAPKPGATNAVEQGGLRLSFGNPDRLGVMVAWWSPANATALPMVWLDDDASARAELDIDAEERDRLDADRDTASDLAREQGAP